MSVRIEFDIHGVDGVLKTLQSLPAEVVSKRGGPVKLALAKGARLLRDEAKKNLRASIAINGDVSTGFLEKHVIASRGKEPTSGRGERYLVRVKRKTYPDRSGKPVTTLKTAHLMEYGSEHQQAQPWLRPAYLAKRGEVVRVVTEDLKQRVDKIVAKLAAQNRGR